MANTEPTPPARPDESAANPPAAEDDDRGYEVPSRTWLVHGAIIVAFALFITVVSLLFVRWWSGSGTVPNASLEFLGDESLSGVSVRIDGTSLDAAMMQKLSPENRYRARFPVPAGLYLVQVSGDNGPLTREVTVSVRESEAPVYDLPKLIKLASTQPTTAAAAATTGPTTQPQ